MRWKTGTALDRYWAASEANDGQASYTVSIMEIRKGKVVRETQYFGDPFEPGSPRVQWVELML